MPDEYICMFEHPKGCLGLEWLEEEAYLGQLHKYIKNGFNQKLSVHLNWDGDSPDDVLLAAYLNCADYANGKIKSGELINHIEELKTKNIGIEVLFHYLHSP